MQISSTQNAYKALQQQRLNTNTKAAEAKPQQQAGPTDDVKLSKPLTRLGRMAVGAGIGTAVGGTALALLGAMGGGVGAGLGALAVGVTAVGGAIVGSKTWSPQEPVLPFKSVDEIKASPEFNKTVPTRAEQVERLKNPAEQFDVLVIGGGATGAGTMLDATMRGLKVAAVEGSDFSAGTSSKSTKLIHGGVRYLEKAVKNLDGEQWGLVKEGLAERRHFLDMAPHLTDEVRLITPVYSGIQLPYIFAGLALYDVLAGDKALTGTEMISKKEVKKRLPAVNDKGLWGGVAYSDGTFNDSRMNVGLATTAAANGAAVANHTKVVELLKNDEGKTIGAKMKDQLTGETYDVHAKVVINATGPFIDGIRKMDEENQPELTVPVAGTHIVVNDLDMPEGLLVPEAPNGSVAFFQPFEGGTLIGTTEEPMGLTLEPTTTERHVNYLIDTANGFLDKESQIERSDVDAVWTGIRPLVKDPATAGGDTTEISRKHIIDVSDSGLVTIGGGKWTAFGRMAEEVVDEAIEQGGFDAGKSDRDGLRLLGSHSYSEGLAEEIQGHYGLDADVAVHLAKNYGDRSVAVAEIAKEQGLGKRLSADHPYLEAEVVYSALNEYAQNPVDVLARRTRLAFVDEQAAISSLPRVNELMAGALEWDESTAKQRLDSATAYFNRNGLNGVAKED